MHLWDGASRGGAGEEEKMNGNNETHGWKGTREEGAASGERMRQGREERKQVKR